MKAKLYEVDNRKPGARRELGTVELADKTTTIDVGRAAQNGRLIIEAITPTATPAKSSKTGK